MVGQQVAGKQPTDGRQTAHKYPTVSKQMTDKCLIDGWQFKLILKQSVSQQLADSQ